MKKLSTDSSCSSSIVRSPLLYLSVLFKKLLLVVNVPLTVFLPSSFESVIELELEFEFYCIVFL